MLTLTDVCGCDGGVPYLLRCKKAKPGYLNFEAAEQKNTFWTMAVHARFLKITVFSVRVGSMGSMEARGWLPLPGGSKLCVGRGNGFTLAHNCNLHDRG